MTAPLAMLLEKIANNPHIQVCKNDLPADVKFPHGMVAVDTETLGLNPLRDRLCVAQVSDGDGNVWLVHFDGTDYSAPNLKKILIDPTLLKIFHYARFDIAVLKHYLGVETAPLYCTKIASKLTRTYTDAHGLKALCQELLDVKLDKYQQTSHWGADELSDAQQRYAASDVFYLVELKKILDERLKQTNRTALANQCFAFLPARAELDLAGWPETDIFAHR